MKIDKWKFDEKERFYQFYLCLKRWQFVLAICLANYDFEIHMGLTNCGDNEEF